MKKIQFIFFAILTLLFVACQSESNSGGSASLSLSGNSEIVSSEGGNVSITVTWSHCKWNLSYNGEMISSVSPTVGGNTSSSGSTNLTVAIAANTSKERTATITVKEIDGTLSKTITLTQEAAEEKEDTPTVTTGDITVKVNSSTKYQEIDGFGCMNGWGTYSLWGESDCDTMFGDLGMSIMRIRIPTDTDSWSAIASKCKYAYDKYGIKILATPWTMPAEWKNTNDLNASGSDGTVSYLLSEHYEDYANYIESFAKFMADNGAPLYAISIQNEPDWKASYEGCIWTAKQMKEFLSNYGHLITSAKVMTGESLNFTYSFYTPSLNDETACANIDIVGGHLYGSTPYQFTLAEEKGKPIWMTEKLFNESWGDNGSGTESAHWKETMEMLEEMDATMQVGWNAYIWWWGKRYYSFVGDGEGSTTDGEVLKRGHAFGQFSRYIDAGDVRIDATSTSEDVLATAYETTNGIVTVLINTSSSSKTVSIDFGKDASGATATVTSINKNHATLDVTISGTMATVSLPANSVSTIVE